MNPRTIAFIATFTAIAATAMPASAQFNQAIDQAQAVAEGVLQTPDKAFMMQAAAGGIAEVEMARIALQKSTDTEVKKHAQHMLDDHTKANDELKALAAKRNVTLPTVPEAKHQELIRKLNGLTRKEFDKTYIQESGIDGHREMRMLFQNEINSGKDTDVKAFAIKTLPTIESHLSHAETMVKTME